MAINFSTAPERIIATGLPMELVRGEEQTFLDRLIPLVSQGSVAVDFARVTRIDAAGIAALITVYSDACKAGTHFTLINASARVREILALVGLDGFLLAPGGANQPRHRAAMMQGAA